MTGDVQREALDAPEYTPLPRPDRVPGKAGPPSRVVERDVPFEVNEDGCFVWTGALNKTGYGTVKHFGQGRNAHRAIWLDTVGQLPDDAHLDHLCRNRRCINPDHMEVVTPRENTLRGAGASAVHARKQECHRGHPFDEENTRITYLGRRVCRTCNSDWNKARRRNARADALGPQ